MRPGNIVTLPNHQCSQQPVIDQGINRASVVIGSMVAAGLVLMAWVSAYWVRPVETVAPITDASEFSASGKALERSGSLSGLEVIF